MSILKEFPKPFLLMISSFLCVIGATTFLFFTDHKVAATAVGEIGPLVIVLSALGYIVLIDSKKRWPDVHWTERLARTLTFHRG